MNREEQAAAIEAILFVAGTGVELEVLAQALGITQLEISALADELIQKKDDARGQMCIRDRCRIFPVFVRPIMIP